MGRTPENIAEQIAGIVGSTCHVHIAWAALSEEERKQMISEWEAPLRRDPSRAEDSDNGQYLVAL